MRHARLIVMVALTATALVTIAFAASQQPTGDPFSTEIRKLKDGLYVIPGYDGAVTGGNVAVRVTSEGAIIVDDRLAVAGEIAGKVKSVTPQPIKYVLSTHGHGDHTGGHPEFIKVAEIIAHGTTGQTWCAASWQRRRGCLQRSGGRVSRRDRSAGDLHGAWPHQRATP